MPTISKEYYENLKDFSDSFLSFVSKLQNNKGFTDFLIKIGLTQQTELKYAARFSFPK